MNDAHERLANSTDNSVLDAVQKIPELNLLKHLDDDHILKKISLSIEKTKFIAYPSSTAFMMLLSVFSGYACRSYKVARDAHDKRGIPLGIYAVAEQPSGSGKDFPMGLINNVFDDAYYKVKETARKRFNEALTAKKEMNSKDQDQDVIDELKAAERFLEATKLYKLSLSDATPAGLEKTLIDTRGFYTLCSSEQSLINVLVGGMYSNGQSNNEVLLKGFDGEVVKVSRSGRESFDGLAAGSLTVFAQTGSFKKIFASSEQSGLHERILKIAEPNYGGYRDFVNGKSFNWFLKDELERMLESFVDDLFSESRLVSPQSFYDLFFLTISAKSESELDYFRQEMEDLVKPGGVYHQAKTDMLGTLTKCNIQVLKIAACLHLLSREYFLSKNNVIENSYVTAAINITRDILMSYTELMRREFVAGENAEYDKIIIYLEKHKKAPIRAIQQSLGAVKPFSGMPNRSKYIRSVILKMIEEGLLKTVIDAHTEIEVIVTA